MRTWTKLSVLTAGTFLASGCGLVLGLDDFVAATTSGATSSSGSGMGGNSNSATGAGGTGGGLGSACEAGVIKPCTTGLLGICATGKQTCLKDQSAYGECIPDFAPAAADDCTTKKDANCDGIVSCSCMKNETLVCMTGLFGACAAGTQTCNDDLTGFGTCVPDTTAASKDDCTSHVDANCNNVDDCVCTSGATKPCYSGPAGTQNTGICKDGTQTCAADGSAWSACVGQVTPATEDCKTKGDENCDGTACSDCVWSLITGPGAPEDVKSIQVDKSGNTLVAGTFNGTMKFVSVSAPANNVSLTAGGKDDYFVAKFAPNGDVLWAKNLAAINPNSGSTISLTTDKAGNVAIGGHLTGSAKFDGVNPVSAPGKYGDSFVAVYNSNGNYKWSKFLSDGVGVAIQVKFDSLGNLIVGGFFSGSLTLGATTIAAVSQQDLFLTKFSGSVGAQMPYGPANANVARFSGTAATSTTMSQIALDGSDDVYVTGHFGDNLKFGAGFSNLDLQTQGSQSDMFLIRLNSLGIPTATKWVAVDASSSRTIIDTDSSGNLLVAGRINAFPPADIDFGNGSGVVPAPVSSSMFVAKYNGTFALAWVKVFTGTVPSNDVAVDAIVTDAQDNVVAAGAFYGDLNFGGGALVQPATTSYSAFLAKLDANGGHLWSKSFSGTGQYNEAHAIAIDPANQNILLGASCEGTINFGCSPLVASEVNNSESLCVTRFQP